MSKESLKDEGRQGFLRPSKKMDKKLIFIILVFLLALFVIFYVKREAIRELDSLLDMPLIVPKSSEELEEEPAGDFESTWGFEMEKEYAKVGEETIYGADLNFYILVYYGDVVTKGEPLTESIKNDVLNKVVRDSRILQGAAELGLLELEDSFFVGPVKDNDERLSRAQQVEEKIKSEVLNTVSGEQLSIWFHPVVNNEESEFNYEEAKQIAREKIEDVYQGLKSGQYSSFEGAAEIIQNNATLKKIDPSLEANSYVVLEGIPMGSDFSDDADLEQAFFSLNEGEMSSILTVEINSSDLEKAVPYRYAILKVTERKEDGYESFDNWLKEQENRYHLEIYTL